MALGLGSHKNEWKLLAIWWQIRGQAQAQAQAEASVWRLPYFYHGHKGCGWIYGCEDSQNNRRLLFYGPTFFIRAGWTTNDSHSGNFHFNFPFSAFHLHSCRSCWTQCIATSPGSTWCGWATARAYPATPRSCRIWTIKPSFSRRPCSRPWRPIRINWLRNWKSIRIRLRRDFAIRRVSPTLIGKLLLSPPQLHISSLGSSCSRFHCLWGHVWFMA